MFQFEKLLKQNNISENDPELPRVILKQIEKFRYIQSTITSETPFSEKETLENQLDEIDDNIMKTLPEFFDIEDEAEINKQKSQSEKVEKEKAASEKSKKEKEEKEAMEAELNKPATNDDDALDKLFRKGKSKVSVGDLKNAGFNTSFWGNLGPHGCSTKRYVLKKEDILNSFYDLIKK